MNVFYQPTLQQIAKLNQPWSCSYSGGKDSTSLVTWIEWLRRTKQITQPNPRLVQADTGVEYPELQSVSADLTARLKTCGWDCTLVTPLVHEKLYNRILGLGVTPIYPGIRSMRWCTRSTKIEPMKRWRKSQDSGLAITGLRIGESAMRDAKLKRHGCAAGGECGTPDVDETTYAPILHWSTCHVIDWLSGCVAKEVTAVMQDLLPLTQRLVAIYDVRVDHNVLEWADPVVTAARFGCIGCPAIQENAEPPKSSLRRHPESPLNELYAVWFEARKKANRLWKPPKRRTRNGGYGPIKMAVSKQLFARVMDIQRRAGVVLVGPEDEAFIRKCWDEKAYPRGWTEQDERNEPPNPPQFVVLGNAKE